MLWYLTDYVPHINMIFVSYFALVITVGRLVYRENVRRAWILPTFATTMIALCGFMEMLSWVMHFHTVSGFGSTAMTSMLLDFLKSYLLTDLIYCAFWHPDQLTLVEGWIHHLFYIIIAEKLQRSYSTYVAQPLWVMEIPSAIRAWRELGAIQPVIADRWFAPTFVTFRIVWPAYVITQIAAQDWVFMCIISVITVHCWWAYTNLWH